MYDQNFKNQAVKECVNGQSLAGTAKKYDISLTALRAWIKEYQDRMAQISSLEKKTEPAILGSKIAHKDEAVAVKESMVVLNSVNISVDGYDITISKRDVVRLMEVFYHFDKKEGKRDDV